MKKDRFFSKIEKINKTGIGSCDVLYVKPGARIPEHRHNKGIEIEYVYRGNCKTHKEGEIYVWKRGQPHKLINDSDGEIILICLKVPPHSEEDMNWVDSKRE